MKKSGNLQTSFPDMEKVWKNGKKSGVFFVLKTETSDLLLSEFFSGSQILFKKRKHSIADREVSDLSYASTASWLLCVHSASWDKLGYESWVFISNIL